MPEPSLEAIVAWEDMFLILDAASSKVDLPVIAHCLKLAGREAALQKPSVC